MKSFIPVLLMAAFLGSAAVFAQQKNVTSVDTAKSIKAIAAVKGADARKDTVTSRHLGKIKLTTSPDSAEVSVDSVARGVSPSTVDSLKPGDHVLIVKHKGYFGKKVNVEVVADSAVTIDIALVKPASVVVQSDPASATVILDGKEAGVTPFENAKMKPGEHTLRIAKDKYVPVDVKVNAVEGKTDSLSFLLVAETTKPATVESKQGTKIGLDTTILIVLTSIFAVFGIVILGIESGSK